MCKTFFAEIRGRSGFGVAKSALSLHQLYLTHKYSPWKENAAHYGGLPYT